jgi:protein arginine N-methyltransferase 1
MDKVDEEYFGSYEDLRVHEVMLKDKPRTEGYLNAIKLNPTDFKDKIVLDVGCGTGVLSMFAAKHGAKKVYAVEATVVAQIAELLIQANNLDDRIQVIRGKIESVELPEKVDIIISEWMGYYLLHESMFQSVIIARDRWLKPEGKMYPSQARMYFAPLSLAEYHKENFDNWGDFYGLDFYPLLPFLQQRLMIAPEVMTVAPKQVLSDPILIRDFDLKTVTADDIRSFSVESSFTTKNNENNDDMTDVDSDDINKKVHGFGFWFDVVFAGFDATYILDTSPFKPETHWKQTVLFLPEPIRSRSKPIECRIHFTADENNPRHYNISMELNNSDDDEDGPHGDGCNCGKCRLIAALIADQDPDLTNALSDILFKKKENSE